MNITVAPKNSTVVTTNITVVPRNTPVITTIITVVSQEDPTSHGGVCFLYMCVPPVPGVGPPPLAAGGARPRPTSEFIWVTPDKETYESYLCGFCAFGAVRARVFAVLT